MSTRRYTAADIKILEGLEPIRQRPRMYIGETDQQGMHRLLWAAVGHCLERHFAGMLDHLAVYVDGDEITVAGSRAPFSIADDAVSERNRLLGRELEVLHCGPGWRNGYQTGGEYVDWLSLTNALSRWLVADYRLPHGRHERREYLRGVLQRASEGRHEFDAPDIVLTFEPDHEIFGSAAFDIDVITERLHMLSFLNPHLKIEMHQGAGLHQRSTTFSHPDGLAAYIRLRVAGQAVRGEPTVHTYISGSERVDLALQQTDTPGQHIALYANSCPFSPGHPLEKVLFDAIAESTTAPWMGIEAIVSIWLQDTRPHFILEGERWERYREGDGEVLMTLLRAAIKDALTEQR